MRFSHVLSAHDQIPSAMLGGDNFGVVTSFEFRVPVHCPGGPYSGRRATPGDPSVYRDFARDAPDELGTFVVAVAVMHDTISRAANPATSRRLGAYEGQRSRGLRRTTRAAVPERMLDVEQYRRKCS